MDDDAERRFTLMYRAHYDDIVRFVRRRAPDVDVADVLGQVFLTAWQRLPDIPRGAALPWLYRVARNTLANDVRGRQRSRRLHQRIRTSSPGDEESPDHADLVVDRLALRVAFDQLGQRDQEILRLIAWEGLTVREVATVLECRRTTVAMRVNRLRRKFHHFVVANDVDVARRVAPDGSADPVTERSST